MAICGCILDLAWSAFLSYASSQNHLHKKWKQFQSDRHSPELSGGTTIQKPTVKWFKVGTDYVTRSFQYILFRDEHEKMRKDAAVLALKMRRLEDRIQKIDRKIDGIVKMLCEGQRSRRSSYQGIQLTLRASKIAITFVVI